MSAFQIGDFEFIDLKRAISRTYEHVSAEKKPGVDGTTFWQLGKSGEPFTVLSCVNAPDIDAAESLVAAYQALIGQNPVTVKWANKLLDLKVMVMGVEPLDQGVFATLTSVGGIYPPGTNTRGFVYAQWILHPISQAA